MKKVLLLLGSVAAAMFTGCSNDETVELVQQSAIDFSSFVNKSTRTASDVTTDNLKNVWVYGWRSNSEGDTEQLFNGTELTKQDSGDWTYSTLKYWEPGYKYAFEAIAPQNGTNGVTFTADKTGGKVEFDNSTAAAETDLVYASPVNKDYTSATYANLNPDKVGLTFNHLLSRVKFTFENGLAASSNAKITVTDVKITDAYNSGNVTPKTSATWTVGSDKNLAVSFAPSTTNALTDLAPAATGETEHMYLIPTAAAYNVSFSFKLEQPVGSSSVSTVYECTATIPASVAMESGKSYNFKAKIDLKPIEFSVTVSEWDDFGDQNISVN